MLDELFCPQEVTVWHPVAPEGRDAHGNRRPPAYPKEASELVSGVVVAPGDTTDMALEGHPDGVEVALTLYFPAGYRTSVRGCRVTCGGELYDVVGDPRPYPAGLVPDANDLVVRVSRHAG